MGKQQQIQKVNKQKIEKNNKPIQKKENHSQKPKNEQSQNNKNNNNKNMVQGQKNQQIQKKQNQQKQEQQGQKDSNIKKQKKQKKNKKNKEQKKDDVVLGDDSDENDEASEENLQEFGAPTEEDEQAAQQVLNQFAYEQLKKQSESKKQKEKKILDFKFRNMELVEIFIKKTKNPQVLISSIIPYCQALKDNQKDNNKVVFVDKLSRLIRKFFEKQFSITEDYKEAVDECIQELFVYLAKIQKKNVFKTVQFALFNLIKMRYELNKDDAEFKQFFKKELEEAFKRFVLKKEVHYTENFFRELFKSYFDLCQPIIPQILKLTNSQAQGGAKEHRRKLVLEVVQYVSKLEIYKNTNKETDQEIENLIEGIYTNHKEIKSKKYSDLRKYSDLLLNLIEKSKQSENLKINIKRVVDNWEDQDQELLKIKSKVLSRLTPGEEKNQKKNKAQKE